MTPLPSAPPLPTPAQRAAAGKAARALSPRSGHGDWAPAADRPDPVAILEEQAKSRVPALVPMRYGRMLESPFAFYRGAAAIMAADLAHTPNNGQRVQLCGDAHLSNFGLFASPERDLVFDVNDFDETLPGPWEWDLKRLAASATIAARSNGHTVAEQRAAARATAQAYRLGMRQLADQRNLDIWYSRLDVDAITALAASTGADAEAPLLAKTVRKARRKNSLRAFEKLAEVVDGEARIRSDPPLVVPIADVIGERIPRDEELRRLEGLLGGYASSLPDDRRHLLSGYRYADAAHKVVGVGSVGTRAWIVLLCGRDQSDPLFLQAKEAQASVLEPYLGASTYATHGQRVVEGQRLMQASSDILLGWFHTVGLDGQERDFYVRQLWDGKGSSPVELMDSAALVRYVQLCGRTLARCHARSGDPIAIGAYLGGGGSFDEAIVRFSDAYADRSEQDHAALQAAVDSGRVVAGPGLN